MMQRMVTLIIQELISGKERHMLNAFFEFEVNWMNQSNKSYVHTTSRALGGTRA